MAHLEIRHNVLPVPPRPCNREEPGCLTISCSWVVSFTGGSQFDEMKRSKSESEHSKVLSKELLFGSILRKKLDHQSWSWHEKEKDSSHDCFIQQFFSRRSRFTSQVTMSLLFREPQFKFSKCIMNLFGVNTDFVMGRYTPNYDAPVMILIVKSLGVQNAI